MKKILLILLFASQVFAQSELLLLFDDGGYDADAKVYFDAMTTPLSNSQKARVNTFVKMLKDSLGISSLSSKFDVMYLLANETAEAGLRNLVKRSHDATAVNSPTFTQWEGFQGNGTSSYINTNYNARTQASAYTLNSASFGIYLRTNTVGSNYDVWGAWSTSADGGNANRIQLSFPASSAVNTYSYALNADVDLYTATRSNGMFITSRTSSTNISFYINKSSVTSASRAVTKIPNQNVLLCALNEAFSNPNHFDANQVSFAFLGAVLTDTEVRKLTNCVEAYLDDLGKGVIP
jgi:hypothetical protein